MNIAPLHFTLAVALLLLAGFQPAGAAIAFQDRTESAGLTTNRFGGYGSAWADFNGDGWLDVWIGNHMYRPSLYINNGNGTFTERSAQAWSGNPTLDAHGAAWADFDNDGDQDLAELAGAVGGTQAKPKPFYVNYSGVLIDEATARGLNDAYGRGRTPLWLDWNNDGLLDLYMANMVREDGLAPSRLMLQQTDGKFTPAPGMSIQHKNFFSVNWLGLRLACICYCQVALTPIKCFGLAIPILCPFWWSPRSHCLT